jgi:hypothetical protein
MEFLYTAQGELIKVAQQSKPSLPPPSSTREGFLGARSVVPTSDSAVAHDADKNVSYIDAGRCTYMNCSQCTFDPNTMNGLLKCKCRGPDRVHDGLGAGINDCFAKNRSIDLDENYRFGCMGDIAVRPPKGAYAAPP